MYAGSHWFPISGSRAGRVAALTALSLLVATIAVAAEEGIHEVIVLNLPEQQEVIGEVAVREPIPQTRLVRFGETIVPPVGRDETTSLVDGGTIEAAGFASVVLSLLGQMQAHQFRDGEVGAVLLPDEGPAIEAFEQAGRILLQLEVVAEAKTAAGAHIAGSRPVSTFGFPRYRVFYYNTSDRPATVQLFAYLTN